MEQATFVLLQILLFKIYLFYWN